MKAIKNGIILTENRLLENHVILFEDKIIDIIEIDSYKVSDNIVEYDAKNAYILPGFIDQHIHGYGGYDVMDNSFDAIINIKKSLPQNGVTSFLPTTLTAPKNELQSVCDKVQKAMNENIGAKILGVHLEGPYINPLKKGAQNEKYICAPDKDFIEKNIDIIKIVTIAPETTEALEIIKKYKSINFQIGHTNATFVEANSGIHAGAKGFTHTFNAMTGIHHRDLGAVGSCMLNKDTYAEMICDNIHIDKDVYSFVLKNKDIDKILLISDSMRGAGCPEGEYNLGGLKVTLKNNACHLEDGTLAGSVLRLNHGLKNLIDNSNISFVDAVKMVTENQAKYLGLDTIIGKLKVGFCSDIVIMDKNYNIKNTFIKGECAYEI